MDSANTDIEKLIMMEMEREIENTKPRIQDIPKTTTIPPLFELTPMDDHSEESDAVQAEIERRLRRKQHNRDPYSMPASSFSDHADDSFNENRNSTSNVTADADTYNHHQIEQINQLFANQTPETKGNVSQHVQENDYAIQEAEKQEKHRQAEKQARRQAEEQARHQAEEQARRQAEEQARHQAEEQARRQAEEQARHQAEEKARHQAEEQARHQAEKQARRQAEEQARHQAEEQARRQAEEQARRQAEEQARRQAEEQARRQAEEQARRQAEEQARRQAEEQARHQAEEQARRQAEGLRKEVVISRSSESETSPRGGERAHVDPLDSHSQSSVEELIAKRVEEELQRRLQSERRVVPVAAIASPVAHERGADLTERVKGNFEGAENGVTRADRPVTYDEDEEGSGSNHSSSDMGAETDGSGHDECEDTASDLRSVVSTVPGGLQNNNGILGDDICEVTFGEVPPDESFEDCYMRELNSMGISEDDVRQLRIECHEYETIREPGRCLYPSTEVRDDVTLTASIQLGFFRSKQVIFTGILPRPKRIADRETRTDPGRKALSSLQCYFETELLQDPNVTIDDDDLPHNAPSECVVEVKDLLPESFKGTVNRALSRFSFGDPIQVWDRASDRSSEVAEPSKKNHQQTLSTETQTAGVIWSNDVDTKKPTAAVNVFNGGAVLQVRSKKLGGPMVDIHGDAVDPILVAAAFYSIGGTSNLKVSETFFFDSSVDIFFPHKERKDLQRENRIAAFIPLEFRSTLHLVIRVFRPSSEDFDEYVDLYTRPDRYKSHHVAPMKERTQLLAMTSDVMEEMGWAVVNCMQDGKPVQSVEVKKLYRKPVDDSQMYKLVPDERSRNSLKTVPFEIEFELTDRSTHEVAFPSQYTEPRPEENESMVSLLDPDVPGARAEITRYVPCAIPILNSGFFHAYHNVYYFRISKVKVVSTGVMRKVPSTHRTFVMQICVKDQDVSLNEEGLPLIYGRRLSGQMLDTSAWTSTVHYTSEFDLSDEFKIQLPLYLNDSHHIFITLYAAHMRKNAPTAGQQRLIKVGYAAFPLCRNGVLQVKDNWGINFIAADQATVVAAGGYLSKFLEAPSATLLNNGAPVVTASTQARTSVHASNKTIAGIFRESPASLQRITKDDGILQTCGRLSSNCTNEDDDVHMAVLQLCQQLPLAEILAFYPYLCSFTLALVSSPSKRVSLKCRTTALDALIDMTYKTQQYDAGSRNRRRLGQQQQQQQQQVASSSGLKTSVSSILYFHLTNNVLYTGTRYRLYAGVAEVWLNLLSFARNAPMGPASPTSVPSSPLKADPTKRNLKKQMAELSWFLFDVILRSIYMWALENPKLSREQLFDTSFYETIGELCVQVLDVLGGFNTDGVLVQRVALFARNLANYCDRGRVLHIHRRIVTFLDEKCDADSLCTYLRLLLEAPDSVTLILPSHAHAEPVFLSRILVSAFSHLMLHKERSNRSRSGSVLHNFLRNLSNNSRIPSVKLRLLAAQLFPFLTSAASQWKSFTQLYEKADTTTSVREKRQFVVNLLWIIYYVPHVVLEQWLQNTKDSKATVGLMTLLSDAQTLLRFNGGVDKADPKKSKALATELREWDARMSTFTTAIGVRLASKFLEDIPHALRTVQLDKMGPVVFPFFVLLESVLNLGESTVGLQLGSCVLFETVCVLFPEIMSRTARMSSGMILLAFRLMSTCCRYVRASAGRTFLLMSQSFFTWTGSLARIKSLTANALVSVAESKSRSLRLAGRFIEFQLDDLIERAKREEQNFNPPSLDFNVRYQNDSNEPGGDSGARYQYRVHDLFLSVEPLVPISSYLLDRNQNKVAPRRHDSDAVENPPRFADEFAAMSEAALSLFRDVLRLQVDTSMKFKEARIFAYFEVFRNFLRQNALREVLKWLHRLHGAHKADGDMAEAGMVLIFIAALCFRVTEVFYRLRGQSTRGARMPFALMSHVFWHDYVRILPELNLLLPADTVFAIVSELHVCPDEPCFTMEGQVKALKEAAEHLDKDQYYEFSIGAITLVDKYLGAMGDYKGAAAAHTALSTWCAGVAQSGKRRNHRYFLLWARMERMEPHKTRRELQQEGDDTMLGDRPHGLPGGRSIKRVYKMPPTTTVKDFTDYAKAYVSTLFEDPSLIVLTEELTDTQPALPEPTSRRQRVAAMHRPPNHCLVTVYAVHASFPKGEPVPPDGFDKAMHIQKFENVMHVGPKVETASPRTLDLMNVRMSINTYTLDRAFPSTTSAIDVKTTSEVLLDPYETALETLNHRMDIIQQAAENEALIVILRDALSPMGITPPGAYMKEVIATMGGYTDVILAVKNLSALARQKLLICEKKDAVTKSPNDYALVLKAVTDIECCLIAMEEGPCESIDEVNGN